MEAKNIDDYKEIVKKLVEEQEALFIEKSKLRGAAAVYKDELIKAEGLIKLHEKDLAKRNVNLDKMKDLENSIAIRKQTNHIPIEFKIHNDCRYVIKVLANSPELMAYTYYRYDKEIDPELKEGGMEISLEAYLNGYQEYIRGVLLSMKGMFHCTIDEVDTAKERFNIELNKDFH